MFTDTIYKSDETDFAPSTRSAEYAEVCTVAKLQYDLKRILRVQLKELVHWIDEVDGDPFAECHQKLAATSTCSFGLSN
jgi:hypothetical protein